MATTCGCAAIYLDETIRTYQARIHTRRQDRPGREHRVERLNPRAGQLP
jgi:hypothetical protein